jgi:hypothetical protein
LTDFLSEKKSRIYLENMGKELRILIRRQYQEKIVFGRIIKGKKMLGQFG